jgi:hypothetical protein
MIKSRACFSSSLQLMLGLFSYFEGVEPLEDFVEEIHNSSECKLTWILVFIFSA